MVKTGGIWCTLSARIFSGSESTNQWSRQDTKPPDKPVPYSNEVTKLHCLFNAPVETGFETVNVDLFVTNMSPS